MAVKNKLFWIVLMVLLALVLSACGDSASTPTPQGTLTTPLAINSISPSTATSASLSTAVPSVVPPTLAASTTVPGTSANPDKSGLPPLPGQQALTLESSLATAFAKALGIESATINLYVSDDEPEKVANLVDSTLTGAGYKFALPGAARPTRTNEGYSGAYVKETSPDLIVTARSIPADAAQIPALLNLPALTREETQKVASQITGHKTLLAIGGATGLLKTLFGQATSAPTPTSPARVTLTALPSASPTLPASPSAGTTSAPAPAGNLEQLPYLVIGNPSEGGAIRGPQEGAVDSEGNYYLADSKTYRLLKFDKDGKFKNFIGPDPALPDNSFPRLLTTDKAGNLYVTYSAKDKTIFKYDPSGKSLGQFGEEISSTLYSLAAAPDGNLLAVSGDGLVKYDSSGKISTKLEAKKSGGKLAPGEFDYNSKIRLDNAGNIFLFEIYGDQRVQKFSPDLKFSNQVEVPKDQNGKASFFLDLLFDPEGSLIVAARDHLWKFDSAGKLISDTPTSLPQAYRVIGLPDGKLFVVADVKTTGKYEAQGKQTQVLGRYNAPEPGQFSGAFGVQVDNAGNIYVADGYQSRLQKFDRNGKLLLTIDEKSVGRSFACYFLALDQAGNIYTAGSNRAFGSADTIYKFNPAGKLLGTIGKKGNGDGEFSSTSGLAFDASGNLYVGDRDKLVIQKFGPDGKFLSKFSIKEKETDKANFISLVFDSAGNIFVGRGESNGVLQFSPDGQLKGQLIKTKELQNAAVRSLAIDHQGNLYALLSGFYSGKPILVINKEGQLKASYGSEIAGTKTLEFLGADTLTLDSAGNLYVTEFDGARLQRWNPADTSLKPGSNLP